MSNVYLINLSFGLAGIERRFANLWRVLRRRGVVSPVLVVPAPLGAILKEANLLEDDPDGLVEVDEPAFVTRIANWPLPPAFDVPKAILRSRAGGLALRDVWRRIAQDPSAVMHIGMNTSALRPPDLPAVYECVDSTLSQLDTRHYRRASRRRSIIHCQTTRIRSALDRAFAGRPVRWLTITSPTYFAHYEDAPSAEVRDPRLVVFVGRLASEKNPFLFIEAIARARREGSECRALLLGEGPLRADCEALIARHGLQDVVTIRFSSRPFDDLRRASIFVTLQTGDNYGSQSLLEAMGAGCAVLASDVGETARVVTAEVGVRTALSVEAVAAAIGALVRDPARTRRLGSAAARVARTRFSADAYAAFLENTYRLAASYHEGSASAQSIVQSLNEMNEEMRSNS